MESDVGMYRQKIWDTDELQEQNASLKHGSSWSRLSSTLPWDSGIVDLRACIKARGGHFEYKLYIIVAYWTALLSKTKAKRHEW